MKEFSTQKLAQIIKAKTTRSADSFFNGVSTDSRTIKPSQCFFAITGKNFSGADFLTQAFQKKAACAVVDKNVDTESFNNGQILKVNNSLPALGEFAKYQRKKQKYKVIAITGSVGKTTTKNFIYHVLSKKLPVFQSPKNYNTAIGLPLAVLAADVNRKILILEMGTNSPGEIETLSKIALPDIALITNVKPSHLTGFGSMQKIISEKISITKGLKTDGTLLINADCKKLIQAANQSKLSFTTFGTTENAQIRADNITLQPTSSTFNIAGEQIQLLLPGLGAVQNAVAAWAVCSQYGINIKSFAEDIKSVSTPPMRSELLQIGNLTVLSDCYNANPASMKNALEIVENIKKEKNKRLVFICGDMAELGKQKYKFHKQLGQYIANTGVNLLLTIGDLAKSAADAAKKQAASDFKTKSFEDTLSACNNLADYIRKDDIILVKGSRMNKLELVLKKLKDISFET